MQSSQQVLIIKQQNRLSVPSKIHSHKGFLICYPYGWDIDLFQGNLTALLNFLMVQRTLSNVGRRKDAHPGLQRQNFHADLFSDTFHSSITKSHYTCYTGCEPFNHCCHFSGENNCTLHILLRHWWTFWTSMPPLWVNCNNFGDSLTFILCHHQVNNLSTALFYDQIPAKLSISLSCTMQLSKHCTS